MTTEQQIEPTQADALLREIFLHGHVEGWTGNQNRRDAQHVDAEKGWLLYVSNGALEKTKARHNTTPAPSQHSELADIENLLIYHETGGHEGDGSDHAMQKARAAFDSLRQPPSDAMRNAVIEECAAKVKELWLDGEPYSEASDHIRALTQGKHDHA